MIKILITGIISRKWNHTRSSFFCLTSLVSHKYFESSMLLFMGMHISSYQREASAKKETKHEARPKRGLEVCERDEIWQACLWR